MTKHRVVVLLILLWSCSCIWGQDQTQSVPELQNKGGDILTVNPDTAKFRSFVKQADTQIKIKIDSVPPELFLLDSIRWLDLEFTGRIIVPDELAGVTIGNLYLTGEIGRKEKQRLIRLFPHTDLVFNHTNYAYRNGGRKSLDFPRRWPGPKIANNRFRKVTDGILRVSVAADFDKVIRYVETCKSPYFLYDIDDKRHDYEDEIVGIRVGYAIVLKTGQRVNYRYSGNDYYFYLDEEGNLLNPPSADYPLDLDFLRQMHKCSEKNDFLTLEKARLIALRYIPPEYNRIAAERLIYDIHKKIFYWEIERYYGVWEGEVKFVEIDALTGEVLKVIDSMYENMHYW